MTVRLFETSVQQNLTTNTKINKMKEYTIKIYI